MSQRMLGGARLGGVKFSKKYLKSNVYPNNNNNNMCNNKAKTKPNVKTRFWGLGHNVVNHVLP
jgi:hypothetical protein